MNIIIAGDGEVGFHLAQMLSSEKHNITVIDPHQDLVNLLDSNTDVLAITGDPCSVEILESANVKDADLLLAVLHEEQVNILTCMIGKKLGAKRTIARINNPALFSDERRRFYFQMGVDKFVCPERIASTEIIHLLEQTGAKEVFTIADNKLQIFLIRLTEDAKVLNKTLTQIAAENPNLNFRAVAIHRNRQTIIPTGNDQFLLNDLAYVITKPEGIKQIYNFSGKKHIDIKKVIIVGAGRIGRKTALRLEKKAQVRLIEIDKERCYSAAEELKNTLVINGDTTDIGMLQEEGLSSTDAFIAVTNNSQINILACLHAKKAGVHTTIALVENIDYIDIAQTVGIDTIVNKKLITASYIARFTINADVESTKVLHGVDAELLEFIAKKGSKVTRVPIRNLCLPQGSIIGGIVRNGTGYIAMGDSQIEAQDRVVVFAEPRAIRKVSSFFN